MNDYWRKIFGWSWSRQRKWDTCKLQSYYSYVGKWEGFKGEAKREKLQWLNRKSAWYMIQGELIHEAIESQINQWAIGRPVSKDAAKSLFSFRLSQVQQSPRDFLLDEVNGFHIPDESYDECRQDGLQMLDSFFEIVWPSYSGYKYVKHEEIDSFEIDGTKVWTRVDLVTQMADGTIVVTDWKTGKVVNAAKENRQQLLGYIVWAMQEFRVDESRVRAEVRFLRDPGGRPVLIEAEKKELEEFRDFIVQSAKTMLAVNSEADFPASPSERVCQECAFATICPEGMVHIPAGSRSAPIVAAQQTH